MEAEYEMSSQIKLCKSMYEDNCAYHDTHSMDRTKQTAASVVKPVYPTSQTSPNPVIQEVTGDINSRTKLGSLGKN